MPKTVLIILAAVVALIVIVVLTGMRYLRADDDDDFDDDAPAEHGGSRGRAGQPAAGQARSRQRHGDELPDERPRERVGAGPAARTGSASDDRGQDRSWREDSAIASRNGRASQPGRDQRPARSSRRDPDDISQTTAATARPGKPPRGRADDYDSQPGRRVQADYDRDPRESGVRRDMPSGYDDDLTARRDSRDSRERRARGEGRSASRDRTELLDSRPLASGKDVSADRDERDRRSTTRPNARPDTRKGSQKPDSDVLPAVKPRQSKTKREGEGDWPSNEWDELSDVDYWASLASDKPFTADAPAESARSERRHARSDRDARGGRDARADRDARQERTARADRDARPDRGARPERDSRAERTVRADRDPRQDSRAGSESVTKQMSRPGREPDSGVLPAARHRELPADRPAAARSADSLPAIADDDPLTSPSFPRIASDDSRTYRRTRSATGEFSYGTGRGPGAARPAGAGRTTGEMPSVPAVPRVEPVRGTDVAAVADPYRALSGGHQVPEVSPVPASYQVPAVNGASRYDAAASYQGADSATTSYAARSDAYQVPEPAYGGSAGYQAAPSYPSGTPASYPAGGAPSGGYLPPVTGSTSGFGAETRSGSYHSLPGADPLLPDAGRNGYQPAASYDTTSPYEPAVYPSTNGYDPVGYESASRYSLPADHSGYGNGSGDRPAGYPDAGYPPGDYSSHGATGPASGAHQRPEPGYPSGIYGHGADHAAAASLPAAEASLGFPVYPAPVPADQSGYGTAPYPSAGYDPDGYQPPVREVNGYAGADPYAVDPYGQHGYGGTGY